MKKGALSELAEQLGNFHESAVALTDCPQTRDITGKTYQSMAEAAKCMSSKLLEETNDDLDRALQPQEDHRAQASGIGSRCSRTEASSRSPCLSSYSRSTLFTSPVSLGHVLSERKHTNAQALAQVSTKQCHRMFTTCFFFLCSRNICPLSLALFFSPFLSLALSLLVLACLFPSVPLYSAPLRTAGLPQDTGDLGPVARACGAFSYCWKVTMVSSSCATTHSTQRALSLALST